MIISVLGTDYKITVKRYDEDEVFERNSFCGYCDPYKKEIVVCDMNTYRGWENEDECTKEFCNKENLRHEIVHAFFYESGLWDNSSRDDRPWSKNEEMIDWISLQGVKLYNAWKQAKCL